VLNAKLSSVILPSGIFALSSRQATVMLYYGTSKKKGYKMKKQTKLDWASVEDYKAAFKYLDEQGAPTDNEYLYVELLESAGKTVFVKDLKNWMKSLNTTINLKGFKL
jgi:hypothetical protein